MGNDGYWAKRFERVKQLEMQKADLCKDDLKEIYEEALAKCRKDVEAWYQRYANENGVSYSDAQKILDARQLKAFKMDLREYRKLAKQEGLSEEYQKMLDQASIRARLTKAQELMIKTQMYCERVSKAQNVNISKVLRDVYEDSNYRAAYEIQRMKGKFETFSAVPETQIEKAINTRWAPDGKNFSSRIWENKDKLVNTLRNEISRSLLLKEGTGPMTERIAKQFNTSYHNAERLVETETAYVQELAMLDTYDRLGIDQYEIIATLDSRTSKICQSLDGKVFDRKDAKPGVTMPPFHCYCRSTTAPYIEGITDDDKGTRAARADGEGKTEFADAKMTYFDWLKKYVKPAEKEMGTDDVNQQTTVDFKQLNTADYRMKYEDLTDHKAVNDGLYRETMEILEHRSGTEFEDITAVDARMGERMETNTASNQIQACGFSEEQTARLETGTRKYIGIHNHPYSSIPSRDDILKMFERKNQVGSLIACHNGKLYYISKLRNMEIAKIKQTIASFYKRQKELYAGYKHDKIEEETSKKVLEFLIQHKMIRFVKR